MKTEIKFVSKGWGFEKWIVNKEEYCGKLLFFAKGKKCSWHFHKLKDEVFYIQSGKVTVHFSSGDDLTKSENLLLRKGDNFHVPIGMRHRIEAHEDSEVFEFSTQHFDTDSHRIEKGD
jgi:quercetin dioxygenase-like cupin family protein